MEKFGMNSNNNQLQTTFPHPNIDVFRSQHHPYYIFSLEYVQGSAGLRAYYYLCHILNELGYEAYVVADKPIAGLRTPILTNEILKNHKETGRRPIAVYGETVRGNPLGCETVVRWILNCVGHIGAKIQFGSDDLVFYWNERYSNSDKNIELLSFPLVDREIFNKGNVKDAERSGFCYYAHKYFKFGKGNRQISERIEANGISLCQDIKRTQSEIAEILRRSRVLYCYELSLIAEEAELCGCPVIFVETEYLNGYNLGDIDIIPENEIDFDYIPQHNAAWIRAFEVRVREQWETVGRFIKITQSSAVGNKVTVFRADELIEFISKYSPLYIYGAGGVARHCCLVMKLLGAEIKGIVVSDVQKDENSTKQALYGIPIMRLSEIQREKDNCGIILAMLIKNEDEVIPILNKRGFHNYTRYSLLLN